MGQGGDRVEVGIEVRVWFEVGVGLRVGVVVGFWGGVGGKVGSGLESVSQPELGSV